MLQAAEERLVYGASDVCHFVRYNVSGVESDGQSGRRQAAVLKRSPQEGRFSEAAGLWTIRRWVLEPLLLVQVAYRINEEKREVDLVAIRAVDTNAL